LKSAPRPKCMDPVGLSHLDSIVFGKRCYLFNC